MLIRAGSVLRTNKVALSALGQNILRNVVKKVDNAKITSYATISGRNNTKLTFLCLVWYLFVNLRPK